MSEDIRKTIDKIKNLNQILKEEITKSKGEFYAENNIDPEKFNYLGRGDFGIAYSTGDGRVVKTTSSNNEFNLAKELENNSAKVLECFAKVYKTDIVEDEMSIIMEELDTDSHLEDLYYELTGHLDDQELPIQYLDHLDTDDLDLSEEMMDFIGAVDDIIRGYRYLGVEASDIKPDNMGYSIDGKIKAFDVDDKNR